VLADRLDDVNHRLLVFVDVIGPAHGRAVAIHGQRQPNEVGLPVRNEPFYDLLELAARIRHPQSVVVTTEEDIVEVHTTADPGRA
jgi:hypothetical protein